MGVLISYEVHFDLTVKERRISEISDLSAQPEFWNDNIKAKQLTREKSSLEDEVNEFHILQAAFQDAQALFDLAQEENDEESLKETHELVLSLAERFERVELRKMLSEEADTHNAILAINAGAGGTESQDWAEMLLRMYQKWANSMGLEFKIIDLLPGDDAGIKNVTAIISGKLAYGYLKSEAGVHRLVRISPFDSNKRRHTSFTSVFVTPEVDDDFEVEINSSDLRIDVYRAGGKGGQGVNTTDSAVRITHLPTQIVVTCQQERSQIKNKAQAMKVLRSRLYERYLEEEQKKQTKIEDAKKDIAWGSQIRSYVLHPYKLVKDHRTGQSVSTAERVLDGELDLFIKAYLTCRVTGNWVRGGDEDL